MVWFLDETPLMFGIVGWWLRYRLDSSIISIGPLCCFLGIGIIILWARNAESTVNVPVRGGFGRVTLPNWLPLVAVRLKLVNNGVARAA